MSTHTFQTTSGISYTVNFRTREIVHDFLPVCTLPLLGHRRLLPTTFGDLELSLAEGAKYDAALAEYEARKGPEHTT